MLTTADQGVRRLLPYLSLACCTAALMLTFIRLIDFDAPLTRYVRSLNDHHIDYLHNPWLRELSDRGNQVGKGESLVVLSAALFAAGSLLRHGDLRRAAWQTVLAHFVAGVVNTVIKHLVGRGRPKFMHGSGSDFFPFGGSGWDSFPSGHAMATFAVATVLAVRFPKVRWLVILVALAVSVSRLFRGSHFLTDVVAGAVLGVLIGAVVAHPWKDRRTSFASALMTVTPPVAGVFAVMTTIAQGPAQTRISMIVSEAGLLVALAGILAYVLSRVRPVLLPSPLTMTGALGLMGLGIAMCSGSAWVTAVIVLVWLGHCLRPEHAMPGTDRAHTWPSEAAFGLGVLLTLLTMMELRGALPIG